MSNEVQKALDSLGWHLPEVGKPLGSYVQSVQTGNLLFISGKFPKENGRLRHVGKVGREISIEQGTEAARLAALSVLATARQVVQNLDRIRRVVHLTGHVAVAPGFQDGFDVMEGASEVFVKLFGDRGRHARLVLGVAELPLNACLQLETVLEVE